MRTEFYLQVKHTHTRRVSDTAVIVETWQCFTNSPVIKELLSIVREKPLLNRSNYRITNNQQLPTVAF